RAPHAKGTRLEGEAPPMLRLPSGRLARIEYPTDLSPTVGARIQELFGLRATPRLARGRVALTIEILAPNGRPAQVTDDLASFWHTTYPEGRRELGGPSPKHAGPDDPLTATPTSRPRRTR